MANTRRSPDGKARASDFHLLANNKLALSLEDEVKLVLLLVSMDSLDLTRFQTVKPEHHVFGAKKRVLEGFVGTATTGVSVIRKACHVSLLRSGHV